MRIPFDWNTIAMADSLLLESGPYLSGASYLAMMIRKEKKRKHVSLSLSLTNEVEPDNASNRTLHPPSLTNPREKKTTQYETRSKNTTRNPTFPLQPSLLRASACCPEADDGRLHLFRRESGWISQENALKPKLPHPPQHGDTRGCGLDLRIRRKYSAQRKLVNDFFL